MTGAVPGFSTRIGMAAVSPGVSDTGSGGTETAMERGPVKLGVGVEPAAALRGTMTMLAAIAMRAASHPLPILRLVCYPSISCSWGWRCT
jgi:hypothetical protein